MGLRRIAGKSERIAKTADFTVLHARSYTGEMRLTPHLDVAILMLSGLKNCSLAQWRQTSFSVEGWSRDALYALGQVLY
jgi:hypothetical protein